MGVQLHNGNAPRPFKRQHNHIYPPFTHLLAHSSLGAERRQGHETSQPELIISPKFSHKNTLMFDHRWGMYCRYYMKFEVPALVELGQQASLVGIELTMFRRRVVHSRENAVFLKSLDVVPKRRHTA
jgi:hypothetical protein